jgi:hypothetical protein
MVEYETLKSEEVKFGKNNFIEIARKKAITENGENEFISFSRGYRTEDDRMKWKGSIALPCDPEIIEQISDRLKEML